MRTMRSLSYALTKFDAEISYVSPPEMSLTKELKNELDSYNLRYREVESVEEAVSDADIIYLETVVQPDYTKSREERKGKAELTPKQYRVSRELMREKGKTDAIIMHSLPRMDELPVEIDNTKHAYYWIEAFNGVQIRMALLALILGAME